jgi:hypothetical protein
MRKDDLDPDPMIYCCLCQAHVGFRSTIKAALMGNPIALVGGEIVYVERLVSLLELER